MAAFRPIFAISLFSLLSLAQAQTPYTISAQPDAAWTALFDRMSGWTGADGIFAIPLSGYEGPGRVASGKTLFIFSDTFVGTVNAQTGARQNTSFIHNSMAILDGALPDSSRIRFIWGGTNNAPLTVFTPSTPKGLANPGSWYWLQDGFFNAGNVYVFTILVSPNPTGPPGFQFQENGVTMIKIPLGTNGEPDLTRATQMDVPLFYRNGTTTLFFGGAGVMPNTVAAGAHTPDGYVYVYGRLQGSLAVARILPAQIEDTTKWTYWNGSVWSANIAAASSLGQGGAELSVTPIPDGPLVGKYLMCSSVMNGDVFIRVGNTPVGPFAAAVNVYHPTETNTAQAIYTYNAKAHPSISTSGSDLLITYNVNTTDWNLNLANADIYHPRFIRLQITPNTSILPLKKSQNAGYFWPNYSIFAKRGRNAVGRRITLLKEFR